MIRTYIITGQDDGKTVKDYIRGSLGFSARNLKDLKYDGKILIDGKPVFSSFVLTSGMTLTLEFPDSSSDSIEPEEMPLDIIYEDDDIIAVNKPFALAVHPSQGHRNGTLANGIMHYFKGTSFVFRVLTRLDIDTSGVVIIAKNAVSASKFQYSKPCKKYLAICEGVPETLQGEINAPIGRADGIIKRCIRDDGKPSLTKYKVLSSDGIYSLIEAIPVTGRTHQIRVHLAHIGCPLYGDYLYGTEIDGQRTRLHCTCVSFNHPITGEHTVITAPVPEDFKNFHGLYI